jgi:hypothetical protein
MAVFVGFGVYRRLMGNAADKFCNWSMTNAKWRDDKGVACVSITDRFVPC